jgi:RNA methyltransferase, TrmH family
MSAPLARNNQHVQRLRRLTGRRDARHDDGCVVVEGAKVINEALDAGADLEAIFVSDGADVDVVDRAASLGVACHVVADGVLDKVLDTTTKPPALAAGGFVVVGVDIRDPGNAGTLIRGAEAAGAVGVVLAGSSVDVTSPKVVRSTAGALFHLPVLTNSDLDVVLATFAEWGVSTWGTAVLPGRSVAYDEADLTGPTALLLGNEAHGLSEATLAAMDGMVHIPMAGRTESLNVSMAAAVLCFEAARQRRT